MKRWLQILVFSFLLFPFDCFSQGCSVCTKTAAGLDNKSAKGMNNGILYLAAFPLTILGTIGFIWWKHNKPK
jgi:hypothetical protein